VKQVLIWVLTIGCLVVGWRYVVTNLGTAHDKGLSVTEMQNDAEGGKISTMLVNGEDVTGTYKDSKETFHASIPGNYMDRGEVKDLTDHGVNVTIKNQQGNLYWSALLSFAPILVLVALFMFMMRQMQSGGNKAMSFGKNRARLLSMQQKKITFKDVAGVDEAKEELKEIIEFLRDAQKFQKLGGRIPKGVLMVGPPGTSRSRVRTLWRCLWASVRAAFATCLSRARRMLLASSLSMRSMLWDVTAAQAWAADTMSASRR
jgi:cell division protease FtsH